jgi:phosphate binding protein
MSSTTMTGTLGAVSVHDLIQLTALNRQTCRVRVCAFEADGELSFQDGELVAASYGDLTGDDAVLALVGLTDASFELRTGPARPRPRNVTKPIAELLLEAARRTDEGTLPQPAPRARTPVAAPPAPADRSTGVFIGAIMAILGVGLAGLAAAYVLFGGGQRTRAPAVAGAAREVASAAPAAPAGEAPAPRADAIDSSALVGAREAPPRLISGTTPVRPPGAAEALEPTVVCRILVGEDGSVKEAQVYRPRSELAAFEAAALAAARGFKFEPGRKGGKPVASWLNWPMTFARDAQVPMVRRLQIKGSDTLGGALTPELANAYRAGHPDVDIAVEALGSGTAFVGLFDGSAEIGEASRPINEKELAEAERLGLKLNETVVGYDGIAIIVAAQNPVKEITIDDAGRLFTGKITTWKELGGPDQPVHLISRPSYSGTHGFFKEKVLRHGNAKGPEEFAATTELVEKNEDIVAKVGGDSLAVSYVGAGWATGVKIVAVAPAAGAAAIAPTPETIRSGSYPISRPLLMYTRGAPRGDAAGFLAFVLSPAGQAIVARHGFVASDVQPALAVDSGAPAAPSAAPHVATRIVFKLGATDVDAAGQAQLAALAKDLAAGTGRALIIGNADSEGTGDRNARIALARAQHVAAALARLGVPASRLQVEGAAADRPLATNVTGDGRSLNRRVDVFIVP